MKNDEMGETYKRHGTEQKFIEDCPEKKLRKVADCKIYM
jgi:hypothetical protein